MAEKGTYVYDFPRPMVTVDAVIFCIQDDALSVLLIERNHEPYANCWALPGGFIEMDERLEEAAARELFEETGLSDIPLDLISIFDDPKRDPRGRSIGVAYLGIIEDTPPTPVGGDDARHAAWFRITELPRLGFDHNIIIAKALEKLSHDAACPIQRPSWYNEGILQKIYRALEGELQHRKEEKHEN